MTPLGSGLNNISSLWLVGNDMSPSAEYSFIILCRFFNFCMTSMLFSKKIQGEFPHRFLELYLSKLPYLVLCFTNLSCLPKFWSLSLQFNKTSELCLGFLSLYYSLRDSLQGESWVSQSLEWSNVFSFFRVYRYVLSIT